MISHISGLPFTPESIDLGEYGPLFPDEVVSFMGTKPDGTVVSISVALDGVMDGVGGMEDFQHFEFPAEFSDIVRLEVPSTRWRFDNLRFTTIVPPPLPADPRLNAGFRSATLLYSKPIYDNTLVIGEDFQFVSGFNPAAPTKTKFIPPEGSGFLGFTASPYYDSAEKALYFARRDPWTNEAALVKSKIGPPSDVVTLADMAAAGYPEVDGLTMPRAAGGRMLFLGLIDGDNEFAIFKHQDGAIFTVVNAQTLLPDGSGGSVARAFPRDIAITADSFAFDTSLESSHGRFGLYAAFEGGPIQQVFRGNQELPWQGSTIKVKSFDRFEFTSSGEIRVRATLTDGMAWLRFSGTELVAVSMSARTATPENAGKTVSGNLMESAAGVIFLDAWNGIYRESEGRFFRVAAVGDTMGGEVISLIELKGVPVNPPLRAIVEVRYQSSPATAHLFELLIDEPRNLGPQFGAPIIHPESGHLFIPLSHLTFGHSYWLQRSENLVDWTDVEPIESVEPLQHVAIPPGLLASPSFFRVEDRR
jgi:hypothetical protein